MKYVKSLFILLFIILLVFGSALFRYRTGNIDFKDSDATWHVLLTTKCYDETPASQHLFLPLVTMGGEQNKGIPWGMAIADDVGNYYYISFSPAGFFAPWLFCKIFGLNVSSASLYLFNNILFGVSAIILALLLLSVYEKNQYRYFLVAVGVLSYLFLPELLHGMGMVYWNQSVMQVTLLLQIYAYYQCSINGKKNYRWLFYVLALINPYIEWTGFVANVGFALSEIIINWKLSRITAVKRVTIIGALTISALVLYFAHFFMRIDQDAFLGTLLLRYGVRDSVGPVSVSQLIGGYYDSFKYTVIALLGLIIWNIVKAGSIRINNLVLLFVCAFPIIENMIMLQHSVQYSYDRMKAAFILIILLCEVAKNIMEAYKSVYISVVVIAAIALCSVMNFMSYTKDPSFIWEEDYIESNAIIADYVTREYPDAVYAADSDIRGYMDLLFDRGIYEYQTLESSEMIADQRGTEQVVYIIKDGTEIISVLVEDLTTGQLSMIEECEASICTYEVSRSSWL